MRRLLNHMKLQSALASGSAVTRFAIVTSYDPDKYCCKVNIQPEDKPTGWLPIASPWIGDSWGLFAPPSIGDMVDIHYQESDPDSGYVSLRFYNEVDKPVHAEPGVFYLIHKSGSALKFENDGDVFVISDRDLLGQAGRDVLVTAVRKAVVTSPEIDLVASTKVNVTSPELHCTGKITAIGNIESAANVKDSKRTMQDDRDIYDGHDHNYFSPGGPAQTGNPNQQE